MTSRILVALALVTTTALADDAVPGIPAAEVEPAPEEKPRDVASFSVRILGNRKNASRISGSAHAIDEEELERFDYDDVHRQLKKVPGVYVREEDGFGLRPNIGLRGANSDRSAKVTLLEDGVLLAPAPYAASEAYYFPLTTRLTALEVFKGPASIVAGPHTVGGAVNLVTRRIPSRTEGGLDVAAGRFGTAKLHGHVGTRWKHAGILLEGVRLQSTGFKELDGGGDTGFDKNDVMLKGQLNTDPDAPTMHRLELKAGYATERSNETYLGLSDDDFAANPWRRYAASRNDLMQWWRSQAQLAHVYTREGFEIRTVVYRQDMSRQWNKLNRFRGGPNIAELLNAPVGSRAVYAAILGGTHDSETAEQALMIGTNDRRFVSQGVQSMGRWTFDGLGFKHALQFGARAHVDEIRRHHTEDAWNMRSGALVAEGSPQLTTAKDTGSTTAFAAHVLDEIERGRLHLSPGVRVERYETHWKNELANETSTVPELVVLPGLGAAWSFTRWTSVFAGAHQGFSPLAPGQAADVKSERSWNFELGARHAGRTRSLELIGFFNRYENLVGRCTQSAGCNEELVNAQFNGGEVAIWGAELAGSLTHPITKGLEARASGSYTLTMSRFLSTFQSAFPQFGNVREGDELPYVPVHQAAATLGIGTERWSLDASGTFVGRMRDKAGVGELVDNEATDAQLVLDVVASHFVPGGGKVYLQANNLLNSAFVVSRRPFGVRPNMPLTVLLGYKHEFGAD